MRYFRAWWYAIVTLSQINPPQVVEAVMLSLSLIVFMLWWALHDWQYLILYLSYLLGAIASILAREFTTPSSETTRIRLMALVSLLLLLSGMGIYTSHVIEVA